MIDEFDAAHIKTSLNKAASNLMRQRPCPATERDKPPARRERAKTEPETTALDRSLRGLKNRQSASPIDTRPSDA